VAVLHLGFQARRVGLLVRGSFAGAEDRAAALRLAAMRVADDARSPGQLLSLFEALAEREGFVLETEPIESNELHF